MAEVLWDLVEQAWETGDVEVDGVQTGDVEVNRIGKSAGAPAASAG